MEKIFSIILLVLVVAICAPMVYFLFWSLGWFAIPALGLGWLVSVIFSD